MSSFCVLSGDAKLGALHSVMVNLPLLRLLQPGLKVSLGSREACPFTPSIHTPLALTCEESTARRADVLRDPRLNGLAVPDSC